MVSEKFFRSRAMFLRFLLSLGLLSTPILVTSYRRISNEMCLAQFDTTICFLRQRDNFLCSRLADGILFIPFIIGMIILGNFLFQYLKYFYMQLKRDLASAENVQKEGQDGEGGNNNGKDS